MGDYGGAVLTTAALTYASIQLRRGSRQQFQSALRWRVVFQTLTVGTAALSLLYMKPPGSRIPPPGPDGKPQKLEPWNPEKLERRANETEAEWRARFAAAQSRDEREEEALRRMVDEALRQREAAAAAPPAATNEAPAEAPAPRTMPRIGQDKRAWTFTR
ncbi:unnamed protein product [Malassezia sympodialis ATCC 42132]|uniref:uncharacterized protein n=1 Tax=Malassezia sympodialis (strain ATCC 42132) TaxID=1230383 RepID=UPI0002C2974F|nr:uncharacterized protein MSY001_2669 [Malassezia sympodialis ATCC 42132]CCU99964.1 unnamed protein product [Malassezia sympodialis ATCC 42132]|eukprot:XP_018741184.1 uncharacterized protein MSY001_2669 [Malassezia sympodialis ATCC 42132]